MPCHPGACLAWATQTADTRAGHFPQHAVCPCFTCKRTDRQFFLHATRASDDATSRTWARSGVCARSWTRASPSVCLEGGQTVACAEQSTAFPEKSSHLLD